MRCHRLIAANCTANHARRRSSAKVWRAQVRSALKPIRGGAAEVLAAAEAAHAASNLIDLEADQAVRGGEPAHALQLTRALSPADRCICTSVASGKSSASSSSASPVIRPGAVSVFVTVPAAREPEHELEPLAREHEVKVLCDQAIGEDVDNEHDNDREHLA